MNAKMAYSAYNQDNISIESPEKLIEMLYEGILKFTSLAKRSINDNDMEKKVNWINKSIAIFTELINSLNYDGGEVAHYLSGLYTYQIQSLSRANLENNTDELDSVLNVTKGLLEGWKETVGGTEY